MSFISRSVQTFTGVAAFSVCVVAGQAQADITAYSQDFESLNIADGAALQDGWRVGANVFAAGGGANGEGAFAYNYFDFPAPNGTGAFSNVTDIAGGAPVGNQGLVVFNDYNNGDHGNGSNNRIEAVFFRSYTIGAANVGETWEFSFVAAPGDLGGSSTAHAFIKTLDPLAGFSTTNFLTIDTTSLPSGNTAYALQLEIVPALQGQLFQIGFDSWASNFESSGVNYDDINLQVVPEPSSLALIGLGALAVMRRRRA